MAALVLQAQVGGCLDASDWAGGNFNSPPFGDLHVFSVTTLQRRETTGTSSFIVRHRYCTFHKLKICGSPALNESFSTTFRTTFVHSCLFWVILAVFWSFSSVSYYCDLKSIIFYFTAMSHWRSRWWLAFFSSKIFLIKVCTLFFET